MPTAFASTLRFRSCAHVLSAAALLGLVMFAPASALAQAQQPAPTQPAAPQNDATVPPPATAPDTTAPQEVTPSAPSDAAPVSQEPAPATTASESAPSAPSESPAAPATATDPASTSPAASEPPAVPVETVGEEPATPIEQAPPVGERADIPHDLSPWGMFMAADWVVKGVMIGLAFASLITWTVWLAKTLELMGARTRAGRTLKVIRDSSTLADAVGGIGQRGGPAARMLRAAADEVRLSEAALDHADNGGVKERVSSALSRIESYAGRRMSRGTGVLATIGSTAPFVGLFGTVWGIMNSFIGISESQTTNLAVVAPGIAEALLATALGLVAAIPAVVIYNVFARSITGYRHLLADAAAGVERLVSRDLDFRKMPPGSRKAPVSLVAGE